ncbi:MAG: RnfABCDGE type electron transport complex subunit G [Clostridia bacterium]|nr:RnfABCDGE type electron transport complex subunit G [Candidatus Limimonas egerieequi]MCQ2489609.1 RnfABCDGE type electron transport complex subunit G [Clostridia bacterium]
MKNMNAKDILVPTISLLVICLVATALLALVNNITKDKIAEQVAISEAAARVQVLPDAKEFEEVDMDGDKVTDYYEGIDANGETVGYVFNTIGEAKGYGGDVAVTVGIDTDGIITGIVPGDISNETPGLGQNAGKASWQAQFVGESGDLTVVKSDKAAQENTSDGKINALTSATITSKAVTGSVNVALDMFEEIGGEN